MLRNPAGDIHDRRSVVPTHIEESAQFAIVPADYYQWFACQLCCEKRAGPCHLVHAPDRNPISPKDLFALQAFDALIQIPGCGNGISLLERSVRSIQIQQLGDRHVSSFSFHARVGVCTGIHIASSRS
jgi:hypothetical protein